jgi:flagellar basal-body rod protein FlgF
MIDRFVFTAMTGAKSAMGQLATTSHNMANLQTPGFREMLSSFRAVPVNGSNADSRAFVVDSTPGADWTPGAVTATGNSLDAAIQDQGLFAVLRSNGQEAYTRAGKFQMDAQGFLVNSSGLRVLNEQNQTIQIPVGSQDVAIQPNGTITATLPGQKFETPVARLKLVNPAPHTLERQADGLFTSNQDLASLDDIRLVPGSLESSNVSAAQAMVQMIAQNRLFDLNIRLVQVAEQNSKSAGALMSLSRV